MARRLLAGFDTETTGLDPEKGDRIIEIALRVFDIDTRKLVASLVERCDPHCPIDPKAQAVHGISYTDLIGKPDFAALIPKINAVAKAAPIWVAHNAPFDSMFLANEYRLAGAILPTNIQMVDTIDSRWATPNGKSPKLQELCFALGIAYDPALAHAADYDVDRTIECFFAGLDRGFFTLPELQGQA